MDVLIVNNVKAGQGDAGLFDYVRELNIAGAEVTLRSLRVGKDGPAPALERALRDAADFDRVVAAGGDGTVSSVAYQLRGTGIPVLPYPAGTANLAALNLRIPADAAKCAEITFDGEIVGVDLGEITYATPDAARDEERHASSDPPETTSVGFVNGAGAGLDAWIMQGATGLKSQIGASAYVVSAMQNPEPQLARIKLVLDGRELEVEGSSVLLVNFSRIQFDLPITHGSRATDGVIEVVVFKVRHVAELVGALFGMVMDSIAEYPDRGGVLETYRASEASVFADPPLPLQSDGEALDASTPFDVRVIPRGATFIGPKGALEDSPADGRPL